MAALFWVGGSGTYNGVTNRFATTSGGAASVALATTADTITFDANSGSATITLGVDLNCASLTSSSTLNTFVCGSFNINVAGTGTVWNWTNGTITPGTSNINISGAGATFVGGSRTYANVNFTGSGTAAITGANTFASLTRTGTAALTDALSLSGSQTITGTLTINGNSVINRMNVFSNTIGTARTLTAATVSITNADFMDITGAGAGSWNLSAISGGSGDCGGNSGITFTSSTTQTWSGTSGGNYSANAWTSRVPLPQDLAVLPIAFDPSQTVVIDMPRVAGLNFTGATGNPTLNTPSNMSMFGSLTLVSGMTRTGINTITWASRSTCTITSAGCTFYQFTFNALGGSYTLQDDLVCASTITLTAGSFVANNKNVTCLNFATSGTLTRSVDGGTGTWSVSQAAALNIFTIVTTGLTANFANCTITLTQITSNTRTFAGGGLTYGTFNYTNVGSTGALVFTGANTFANINVTDGSNGRTITFPASTTTTITGTFNIRGTSGNLMSIISSTGGTAATVSKASGVVACNYVSIKDSTATGGASWYAGQNSTDAGGNTGWVFSASPSAATGRATSDRLSTLRLGNLARL